MIGSSNRRESRLTIKKGETTGYKIAVVALATILVAVLITSYSSYFELRSKYFLLENEHSQLKERYSYLENEYSTLSQEYKTQKATYENLQNSFSKLSLDYESLQSKYKLLREDFTNLQREHTQLINEHNVLQQKYSNLSTEYFILTYKYDELFRNYTILSIDYTSLLVNLTHIGVNTQNLGELWKLREVKVSRTYLIYDYKENIWKWYFWHWLPITWYLHERTKIIHEPMKLEDRVIKYSEDLVKEYVNHPLIERIANFLWEASLGDMEVFVNYVLELVHQLPYNETYYAKSPVETFIEGTGDCDNVAILAATILENKGLDTVVIYGYACDESNRCGGHAMIAVALPLPPDDLFHYGRASYWYVDYNGKRFYLAECTPIGGDVANFDNPWFIGFFVGDNPWASFEVEYVVDV